MFKIMWRHLWTTSKNVANAANRSMVSKKGRNSEHHSCWSFAPQSLVKIFFSRRHKNLAKLKDHLIESDRWKKKQKKRPKKTFSLLIRGQLWGETHKSASTYLKNPFFLFFVSTQKRTTSSFFLRSKRKYKKVFV